MEEIAQENHTVEPNNSVDFNYDPVEVAKQKMNDIVGNLQHFHTKLNITDSEYISFLEGLFSKLLEDISELEIQNYELNMMNELKTTALTKMEEALIQHQADFSNYQKRNENELTKAKLSATEKFGRAMILVKEYLDMAANDKTGDFKTLQSGIDITKNIMVKEFEKFNLVPLTTVMGDKFDPYKEEAVSVAPSTENIPKDHIVEVLSIGWRLADKILIPSRVIVAN